MFVWRPWLVPWYYIHNYTAVPMRPLRCEDDASPAAKMTQHPNETALENLGEVPGSRLTKVWPFWS